MDFVEHVEGTTRLFVPSVSLTADPPPTAPVFFNPAASLNRDISVAITAATGGSTFCDAMSGVGARGLRIANEVQRVERVVMIDFNSEALKAAREGAALNGVTGKCVFANSETSSYLHMMFGRDQKFDYVDVDPFGSPVRQLQGALGAVSSGGIVSLTATDTAVLCGVYPRVCSRRYGAIPLNNRFGHETGLRLLAGAVARAGAQIDIGVDPVFAHSTRHYLRLFIRVLPGASRADKALERLGYLGWCPHCGDAAVADRGQVRCTHCGRKVRTAGPIWVGSVANGQVLDSAAEAAERMKLASASKTIRSLQGIDDFPPWSFSIEEASSSLRIATASEAKVREELLQNGWRVMRTPFEKTGIKTDAPFQEFLTATGRSMAEARRVT